MLEIKDKIDELLKEGNKAGAVQMLEECGGANVADEELLLLWGELLYSEGKMTDALNKFNAVVRQNPENGKARNYVTMINNILGYYCKDLLNP